MCRDLIPLGYVRCRHCRGVDVAAVVAPISLCLRASPLHATLRGYKDATQVRVREHHAARLARLVDAFLAEHERCIARAAGIDAFDAVTVVPSSSPVRDALSPALRRLAVRCTTTRERYATLLAPTGTATAERRVDPRRYHTAGDVAARHVLLLEDAWVTGSRAQSAAATLAAAGACSVAVVVIGRFVTPTHGDNAARLATLPWSPHECAVGSSRAHAAG